MNGSRVLRQMIVRGGQLVQHQGYCTRQTSTAFLRRTWAAGPVTTLPTVFSGPQQARCFSSKMSFEEAVKKSTSMNDPDNATKLRMYALYKQATSGKATGKRPGAMEFVKRAKFDAWNELGDMSKEDAQKEYIQIVAGGLSDTSSASGSAEPSPPGSVEGLAVTIENGVRTIRLNRPEKFNALTREMYRGILTNLNQANDDPNTKVVVITGTGKFFCSGNDLSNFMNATDPIKMAKDGRDLLMEFVDSFIYLKKPLIGVINGPAVGISVTVLGMFDSVFCSDQASFSSPFSSLGQSPEGCSSYIFPRIMGYAKASEMLYFNQKLTAAEAERVGLVTKVIPDDRLRAETDQRIKEVAELPMKSLIYSKELVRGRERELLHQVNVAECDRLQERWTSEDCINAIQKFFMRKSKM